MITSLEEIPALTRTWLAPLEKEDPETWAELAASLLILPAAGKIPDLSGLPADVGTVLERLDLAGKEIGAFRFAPTTEAIGSYGADLLLAAPEGIVLLRLDGSRQKLADDFTSFLITQANAFDAYKKHIVKAKDAAAYAAAGQGCTIAGADVPLIFTCQLTA